MAYSSPNPKFTSVTVGGAKDATAAIDVVSTTQGIGFPNMTETQRDAISSPKDGLTVFNTTTGKLDYYNGSAWAPIESTAVATADVSGTTTSFTPVVKSTVKTTSSSYTVLDNDGFDKFLMTTSTSTLTLTLPTASANAGRTLDIIKADTGTGKITVDGEGSETINGLTTQDIYGQYSRLKITCDGTAWFVIGQSMNWLAFTPASTQGFGTISSDNLEWRRVGGDTIEVRGRFTVGTASASEARIFTPNSLNIKQDESGTVICGKALRSVTDTNGWNVTILSEPSVSYVVFGYRNGSASVSSLDKVGGTTITSTGTSFAINYTVPVSEFA